MPHSVAKLHALNTSAAQNLVYVLYANKQLHMLSDRQSCTAVAQTPHGLPWRLIQMRLAGHASEGGHAARDGGAAEPAAAHAAAGHRR